MPDTWREEFRNVACTVGAYFDKTIDKEELPMFTRVVECRAKSGRGEAVSNMLKEGVLPILQGQPGFVDFLVLSDKSNPDRLVCVSFWTSREDTKDYHRQHYDTITNLLEPALESLPSFETFTVSASTAHRIAVASAA